MDRDKTLDLVREIRERMQAGAIGIRWPSSEMLSSATDRRSNRRGNGDEFDGLKEYEPGDDIRHIDWNATAGTGERSSIIVKTYFEARVVRFNVFLDVNPSMNFGSKHTLKSRLAALCAACGIWSAAKMKDRVSFVNFAGEPVTIRKNQGASRSLTEFLIHSLEDGPLAHEHAANQGGGLAQAFQACRQSQRNLVLVVSDFVNTSEEDFEELRISGFKNDTIAVFVQDLRERELPEVPWPGTSYSFEDYHGAEKNIWVTPDKTPAFLGFLTKAIAALAAKLTKASLVTSRKQYLANFKAHETKILERLESCGVKTVVVSTEDEENAVRSVLRVLADKLR
ncbi:MAG: DUF58 domain-containing protein [Candidatus Obscuribacterales bacterium]|nr:DUF58 domain-containing protein [Candidatus Obscuribacterales bacterium]